MAQSLVINDAYSLDQVPVNTSLTQNQCRQTNISNQNTARSRVRGLGTDDDYAVIPTPADLENEGVMIRPLI